MMEMSLHLPPQGEFEIDLEAVVKRARDAGAEALMFYAQDHWGYAHYTSDVGVRHPHLKGDFFGRAVALACQQGMSVAAYYSLQINNQIVLSHPDWAWVDRQGKRPEGRWYNPCLDTPYRDYAVKMIDEICSRYEVDELFLDIFGIQFVQFHSHGQDPFCFCKYTTDAWNREHPGDDYREGFKTREGWLRRYRWHQKRTMVDMLDTIIATGRRHRPKLIISLNGGPEVFPDEIQQKVEFSLRRTAELAHRRRAGGDYPSRLGKTRLSSGRVQYVGLRGPQQRPRPAHPRQCPRCCKTRGSSSSASRPWSASIEGGRGYVSRWFDLAAEAWQDVRNVDCLFEGLQPVTSSMALYSQATQDEMAARNQPRAFRQSMLGALELLTYTGRPVESIPEFRLSPEFLNQFDTLVLPEVDALADGHAELIRQWVRDGGTLVATNRCGLLDEQHRPRDNFVLRDVLGADYVSEDDKYTENYIESAGHPLAEKLARSAVGFAGPYLNIKPTTAKPVMRYRLPWMVEDLAENKWYNWGPPPPGKETGGPAVTLNQFGKGHALYLAFPVFRLFGKHTRPRWIRELIPEFVRQLAPRPVIELQTTVAVGVCSRNLLFRQDAAIGSRPSAEHGAIGHRRRAAPGARRFHCGQWLSAESGRRADALAAAAKPAVDPARRPNGRHSAGIGGIYGHPPTTGATGLIGIENLAH